MIFPDLAILKLAHNYHTPYHHKDIHIDLIRLNSRLANTMLYGSKVIVSGWGATSKQGHASKHLRYTELLVANDTGWGTLVLLGKKASPPGRGACAGDSGGKSLYL